MSLAANAAPAPPGPPVFLQPGEGPLRDFDLLAIGIVLAAVMTIRVARRVIRKR